MSLISLMSEESKQEIFNKFLDVSMYVGTDGNISFSIETDTVKFMMSNLISDIK